MAVELHAGDCLTVLADMADNSIDSVVTDPPYELGFMSRAWDNTGVAFQPNTWRLVFNALKPGAHLAAFGGSRTFHRMAVAIEDAGFEIRDTLMWITGQGFPKSLDISKAIDKAAGAEREVVGPRRLPNGKAHEYNIGFGSGEGFKSEAGPCPITAPATPEAAQWAGWGTSLKPAFEPIILARKPLIGTVAQNVLTHGVGGLNIDACRVPGAFESSWSKSGSKASENNAMSGANYAREPRLDCPAGRWPANVLHDGSDEVLEAFAAYGEKGGEVGMKKHASGTKRILGRFERSDLSTGGGGVRDTGSAARFFYSAKASKADRCGSKHPTIKPVSLKQWICRLTTPPGGTILDPFAGSGTTGQAAMLEGFNAILIEKEAEYCADIRRRLGLGEFELSAAD